MAFTSTYMKEWYELDADGVEWRKTKIDVSHGLARLKCNSSTELDKLEVKVNRFNPKWRDYHVLATDYHSYAIVYSCKDFAKFFKQEYVWVLTRTIIDPTDDEDEYNRILMIVQYTLQNMVPDYNFRKGLILIAQGKELGCQYEADTILEKCNKKLGAKRQEDESQWTTFRRWLCEL